MKKLVILGGGESGVGTAILGKQKGFDVFLSDFGKIKENYKEILIINKIPFEDGGHTESKVLQADVVMKSPGIPDKAPIIKALKEKNVLIVSEIEFAIGYTNAKTIGITGSNGKTTTTLLTYHILKKAGLNVGLAGNIGKSFAWQVAENQFDYYVLELSSFQLDGIVNYRPDIAIITNISPDHLDRYDYNYDNYIASKFRITKNQTKTDCLIFDADDLAIQNWLSKHTTKAQLIPFSLTKTFENGAFIKDNMMNINLDNDHFSLSIEEISLQGNHNLKNAMGASAVANMLNIRKKTIRESMFDFEGVEHRLEPVKKVDQVQYINDSKATNVNSVFFALQSIKNPIIWLVGGEDKGNDYAELMPLVREKVKAIVCIGKDNRKIIDFFGDVVDDIVETNKMSDAVKLAQQFSEKGDVVLLAPACASFDLFINYEDRGKQFKEAVHQL
ncbi:UDP-N-acetylmuramoyl-L-alanine--D-glutamate ligase [Flavobacterium branchiophilum NBRC 15030 = ATCC 35035]|uniref:UDP-N-acetylmuramoylalanine--D-glutamate ligase n=1 Tax=Flavobacterium branchiophilum TaxID=55197 RepID=A0A2H3KBE0_9FLAO|nr:UDP-N-acetylmuramoyl-L-alanine--D-glutamate ligase [Flavobacterium branchiophilum]OXA78100.1 UDP-N-acetylmuramoyl-L-alanine--D-glutamate ligase [Flavobacterium branchiophilum NBRC 15030 = ATCC 35035]PDS24281.1 UDP-N-acetylmuramoyl-L-alanine--D-glutamate ligase [Flavobacterium branchiophilum]TQM41215.1 UDP-N-acetylmuramoylalanine--D-glutamate ligase [Flavobacterium branchiophilum]GEM54428.1 UDP-N-acetylmuramoylalanine--D-glutamate ligase [Flavobacterium branchiophilum NBRC 15030 = ATCC 35035]